MGGDLHLRRKRLDIRRFRSTPPHGGRPVILAGTITATWFRSTPPHGGRQRFPGAGWLVPVSIHAPAWGATALEQLCPMPANGFDPRPRMGGDHCSGRRAPCWPRFDPRPRMGGDPKSHYQRCPCIRFDPRPRMGGDCGMSTLLIYNDKELTPREPTARMRATYRIYSGRLPKTSKTLECSLARTLQAIPEHSGIAHQQQPAKIAAARPD